MNANAANTDEKYAWVDALLENCALQEQRDRDRECDNQMDVEEANPEWNEDESEDEDGAGAEEDDYMEHCQNCNAVFETDRQLGYHQTVCMPGNDLCADFLDRPPPLTRQNCCFLTEVVDELTGDISWVETDANGCVEVDEPDEDLVADNSMEDDGEDEDQALYHLKRYCNPNFAPFKKQKTYHEHPIPEPIPMDICDSDDDYMSENDELEPRELFPDEEEDEDNVIDDEDKLSIMSDIEVVPVDDDECICDHDVEANEDPHADIIFPEFDNDGNILPIPMDVVDEEEDEEEEEQAPNLGPAPCFQRANTFWVDEESGQIVYNGNPNGLRFYNEEDNLAEARYHSNVYELEVTYGNGQNVHNRHDAERVAWLINAIEEYNRRDQHKF